MDPRARQAHQPRATVNGRDRAEVRHVEDDRRPVEALPARHGAAGEPGVRALGDHAGVRVHARLQGIDRLLQSAGLDEREGLAGTEARALLVDAEVHLRGADDLDQLGFQRLLCRRQFDAALAASPKARGQRASALLVVGLSSAVPARESPTGPRREPDAPRPRRARQPA